jgi:amino acid transporter
MNSSEKSGFRRELSWRDGFAIALVIPVAIFATIGPAIAAIGTWAVAALFAISCVLALAQNRIFAELSAMFPDKPGGIALYAHEAWRRYFTPIGSIAAFGYWAGWAFANAVFALTLGQLLQAQFFPDATWTVSVGGPDVGLAHFIGVGCLITVWGLNTLGIRPAVQLNKVLGLVAVGLMGILVVGPLLTGDFHVHNLTWGLGADDQAWGGLRLALVFLFIFGWTAYGTEIGATFAPEYRNRHRDTSLALRCAGLFTLVVATTLPLGLGGNVGDAAITKDPGGFYTGAFERVIGPASGLVTIVLCASLYLVMNSCTADAGRALYGIAKDDMTIKQLNHLNSNGVPARAMFLDLVLNIVMVLFVGNVLAIIFTANVGYFVAICFALSGFLLLRRDRPDWPRPIRLGRGWIAVATALVAVNLVLLVVGFLNPADAGYGGATEQLIGVGILLLSVVLFAYRRLVQDHAALQLAERVPAVAPDAGPSAPTSGAARRAPAVAVGSGSSGDRGRPIEAADRCAP